MAATSKQKRQNILIIVESPKKIKKLSSFLPNDNDYHILPTIGHVMELAKKGKYNLGIDLEADYKPDFVLSGDRVDVMNALKSQAKRADKILVATDPDREGEQIGASVLSGLDVSGKVVKRIKFGEITKNSFLKSLQNETDIDQNLVAAAVARRVLDRVVGFLASPLVIKRLGKGLSAGRVQSVALRMVVDREREIEAFKPEEYWVIQAHLKKTGSELPVVARLVKPAAADAKQAGAFQKALVKAKYVVSKIDSSEKKKYPPVPVTTADMQKIASSRYSFAAQRTMKAAQSLYESGKITYIRTDSVRQSDEAIDDIRSWLKANHPKHLPKKHIAYTNKDAAQDAHEAIRPTSVGCLPVQSPSTDDEKIYKLVWEITVASQMNPAVFDTTSVVVEADGKYELRANGRILKNPGWLDITKYVDIEKEDTKDTILPVLVLDETLELKDPPGVVSEQKFTQPPSRFSEATLLGELKKRGIGRPSTYADIMSKISDRQYVVKKGKALIASDTGKLVVDLLTKYFDFMKYEYTSDMEEKLDRIGSGAYSYLQMMEDFYPPFKVMVDQAYQDGGTYRDGDGPKIKTICSRCGKPMLIKKSNFGYFLGCSGYPDCKNIVPCKMVDGKITPVSKEHDKAPGDVKCPKCGSSMVKRDGKFGPFYGCSNYPECNGHEKMPYGKNCPKCGKGLFRTEFKKPPYKGPVLCCSGYPECRYLEKLKKEPD